MAALAILPATSAALRMYDWKPYWNEPVAADAIVLGQVVGKRNIVSPDSSLAFTDYVIRASEVWKGGFVPRDTLVVRIPGGLLPNGLVEWVEDTPKMDEDRPMVLFLRRDHRWPAAWTCWEDEVWIVQGERLSGMVLSGIGLGEFRRLVQDALWRAPRDSALWRLPRESIPPGTGRIHGSMVTPLDRYAMIHIPSLRLVAPIEGYSRRFELPPLPAGTYEMDLFPEDAETKPGKARIEVRPGKADSVVVVGYCCSFDVLRR